MSGEPFDPEIRLRLRAADGPGQKASFTESDVIACRWAVEEIDRLRSALRRRSDEPNTCD